MIRLREDISERNLEFPREFKGIFFRLYKGIEENEVSNLLDREKAFLSKLFKSNLLINISKNCSRNEKWFAHFVKNANDELNRLESKRVLILGCGGTGSIVADHLARSGVKNFHLIDGAKFDEPDLNRQLPFQREDIGSFKTEALAKYLSTNFDCIVSKLNDYINNEKDLDKVDLKGFDLIINCADKPKGIIQRIVCEMSIIANTPVLFGSVGINDYVIGPLLKSKNQKKSFKNQFSKISDDDRIINGSICFLNTIASADLAFMAFKYLTNQSTSEIEDAILIKNPIEYSNERFTFH